MAKQEKKRFEEIIGELESVVRALEGGDLPLEQALEKFEEGVRLSKEGSTRLSEAERRIEEILADGSLRELTDGDLNLGGDH